MAKSYRVHEEGNPMEYKTPEVKNLGSLSDLTLGMGGSSMDGHCRNNVQLGGGNDLTGHPCQL